MKTCLVGRVAASSSARIGVAVTVVLRSSSVHCQMTSMSRGPIAASEPRVDSGAAHVFATRRRWFNPLPRSRGSCWVARRSIRSCRGCLLHATLTFPLAGRARGRHWSSRGKRVRIAILPLASKSPFARAARRRTSAADDPPGNAPVCGTAPRSRRGSRHQRATCGRTSADHGRNESSRGSLLEARVPILAGVVVARDRCQTSGHHWCHRDRRVPSSRDRASSQEEKS